MSSSEAQTAETALRRIVEDAYRAFRRDDPPRGFNVCHCNVCMTEAAEREMASTPLREIPSGLLAEYTNSAHGWNDAAIADDMRYLLPRYLELIAADDAPDHLGSDIVLRRLKEAEWRVRWPKGQAAVLERFFPAYVRVRLMNLSTVEWPVGWLLADDIRDALTLTVTAGAPLRPVLDAWDAAGDPHAAIHMAALRRYLGSRDGAWTLRSSFLESDHKGEAVLIGEFLMRPGVDKRLEAAFFMTDDPRLQKIVSDAIGMGG
jgi:hypothetical protein